MAGKDGLVIGPVSDQATLILVDMASRDRRADTGERINDRPGPQEDAGIQDGIAADLHILSDHGAEFPQTRLNFLLPVADRDQFTVSPDIGGDGTGAHVGPVGQDTVPDIIEMWDLDVTEEEDIFKLR
jgi:hypothetical protein